MRRILICLTLILIGLSLSLLATSAQATWSMWVYESLSGRLLRVDNNGQVISGQNITAFAENLYPQDPVISVDGRKVAYTDINSQQIIVMNLENGQILAEIDLSEIGIEHNEDDWLYLSDVAFSLDSEQLVYVEILGGFGWQIHVYDFASESIIQTLRYGDESAQHFPALHGGILPIISQISRDKVTFSADIYYPVGIHSYHWFYQGNILSETVAAPTTNTVAFPYTNDFINVLHDYRFPTDNDDFRYSFWQINTLHAYTATQGRFPIFSDATLSFENVWFVQAGERVLAQAYLDEIRDVWVLIERDGNEVRRYPVAGRDVTNTPDGFIYTTPVEAQTAVVTVNTRSETAGDTLWLQPGQWRILWAGSNQVNDSFVDWVQLAQSIEDPTGIADQYSTPTPLPPYPPFRRIGQEIQVFVLEEGFLNLRDAPTVNSNILTLLESGARGTIIGGPVEADGFIWWEVSMSSRTGWLVESLDESIALIPPQLIPPLTPTPTVTASP
ncbi:MAG: hypothetical protein Phog2KO_31680 [Phototrophicaceae bacterium]